MNTWVSEVYKHFKLPPNIVVKGDGTVQYVFVCKSYVIEFYWSIDLIQYKVIHHYQLPENATMFLLEISDAISSPVLEMKLARAPKWKRLLMAVSIPMKRSGISLWNGLHPALGHMPSSQMCHFKLYSECYMAKYEFSPPILSPVIFALFLNNLVVQ